MCLRIHGTVAIQVKLLMRGHRLRRHNCNRAYSIFKSVLVWKLVAMHQ